MMGAKTGCFISIFIIFAAYLYKRHSDDILHQQLNTVLKSLLRAERKAGLHNERRVAVGFGACRDIVADAMTIMHKIGANPPDVPEHFNPINSKEQLENVFAYFFRHGAAAERFIKNETVFWDLVNVAKTLDECELKLGGNAPVMASRFQKEGCRVLLGSMMSPELRKELDPEMEVAGGELEEDDVHLLMEYNKGDTWGKYQSARANRLIVHNDQNNPFISSLEDFAEELKYFSPTLLVVGGLQMLDSYPFEGGQRKERLGKLKNLLISTPKETRIHFEMASFAEEECLLDVIDNVAYYSDSLGMNEQELPNLHSSLVNRSVTLVSDPYPRIATTLDHMRTVYRILNGIEETGGRRKLTRLHVHTLAFQAILTTRGSSWKNSMSAAAKASLTANRHTCGSNYIEANKAKILMDDSFSTSQDSGRKIPFRADRPVSCWEEEDFEVCLAPVLVCTEVVQTGGGGDNISSAGLVLQI